MRCNASRRSDLTPNNSAGGGLQRGRDGCVLATARRAWPQAQSEIANFPRGGGSSETNARKLPNLLAYSRSISHDKLSLQQYDISVRLHTGALFPGGENINGEIGHFDIVLRERR